LATAVGAVCAPFVAVPTVPDTFCAACATGTAAACAGFVSELDADVSFGAALDVTLLTAFDAVFGTDAAGFVADPLPDGPAGAPMPCASPTGVATHSAMQTIPSARPTDRQDTATCKQPANRQDSASGEPADRVGIAVAE